VASFKAFQRLVALASLAGLSACGTNLLPGSPSSGPAFRAAGDPGSGAPLREGLEDYYRPVGSGTGKTFLLAINRVVSPHRNFGYDEARDLLFGAVDDPRDANQVPCIYTGRVAPGVDNRESATRQKLNAEHVWPQSKGAVGPGRTDLHHLFASDVDTNNRRSSYPMGHVEMVYWEARDGGVPGTSQNSRLGKDAAGNLVFEPRTSVRGDVARALLYFYTVYGIGKQRASVDLANFRLELPILLRWHTQDPVDQAERDRLERVFAVQGNRNPYIDHPEWVFRVGQFL
jgi:deoxyribonuclease-1